MPFEQLLQAVSIAYWAWSTSCMSTCLGCSSVSTPSGGRALASPAVGLGIWRCRGTQGACITMASPPDSSQRAGDSGVAGRRAVQRLLREMQ